MKETHSERTPRRAGRIAAAATALALVAGPMAFVGTAPLYASEAINPAPAGQEGALPGSLADVVEKVAPAVVSIQVEKKIGGMSMGGGRLPDNMPEFFKRFFGDERFQDFFGMPNQEQVPERRVGGIGSGFIIDPEGYIVTNNHVAEDADKITVTLQGGKTFDAELIGADPKTDLALVKVEADEPLPYVEWGDSDTARVGDWIIAVGNPFGLGQTVTTGIISARGRSIGAGPYDDFLQVSAPINRGNSGGPTLDTHGRVIGVNTAIFSPSGGSVGIGFAIPSNMAADVVAQLKEHGKVERGWLGVMIQSVNEDLAAGLNLPSAEGAIVSQVTPGGPAEKAGIRQGDVIIAVNGERIEEMRELPRVIAGIEAGDTASIEIWRDGREMTVDAAIGSMPEEQQVAASDERGGGTEDALGLRLAQLDAATRERLGLEDSVEGVLITGVRSDSPAADKGLSAGDVIVSVENQRVTSPADVRERIAAAKKDDRKALVMLVARDAQQRFVALPLTA